MVYQTAHPRHSSLELHRHSQPYLSLVLRGDYEEKSVDGTFLATTGSVLYHPPFHLHANVFSKSDAVVLNLDIQLERQFGYRVVRATQSRRSLEQMMRSRSRELVATVQDALLSEVTNPQKTPSWLTALAEVLRDSTNCDPLYLHCRSLGVSVEHASREFRRFFGASPSRFRREHRMRTACAALSAGHSPSEAAHSAGFADQSHFGRVMKSETGVSPGAYVRHCCSS